MTAEELAQRLEQAKGRNGKWVACCPAHEDHTPSLSIGTGTDGKLLLHCHAGCTTDAILGALGLPATALFPEERTNGDHRPEVAATYDYTDRDGQLLFQVVRLLPKQFRQRRPAPQGGWFWNIGDTPRVLFQLPLVQAAILTGEPVYVVEGEKDALTLRTWDLVGTTNPGGAGKWRDDYTESLRDAHVVIVPDNDKPGREHGDTILQSLHGVAASVRLVLPFPSAKDVTEWAVQGHGKAEFLAHVAPPPPPPPPFYYLTDLFQRPELLLPPPVIVPRLAWEGRVTLLAAREKVGKSTLMGQATAALAAAPSEMLEDNIPGPLKTLWIGIDEPLGDIVRRLDRYQLNVGALAGRVAVRNAKPDAEELCAWIRAEEFRLIILDHLTSYASGRVEDPNKAMQYQPIMQELAQVAQQTSVGLVVLHHSAKGGGYRDSTAIGAGVDAIIIMRPEMGEDGEEATGPKSLVRKFTCKGRVPMEHAFQTEYQGGYHVLMRSDLPLDQRILRFVGGNPGCSGREIRSGVGGRHQAVLETVQQLAQNGLILDQGKGGKAKWFTPFNGNRGMVPEVVPSCSGGTSDD